MCLVIFHLSCYKRFKKETSYLNKELSEMSLLKLLIAGLIIVGILVLGGLVVLAIIGFVAVSFVQWLETNPVLKAVFVLVGLVLIIGLFLAFSKWVLGETV